MAPAALTQSSALAYMSRTTGRCESFMTVCSWRQHPCLILNRLF
jgi:hypothetical protein